MRTKRQIHKLVHEAPWPEDGADPKLEAWLKARNAERAADTTKARLFHQNGEVSTFDEDRTAYAVWLATPKGVRIAFRGIGDKTPVYSHDYVDSI